MHMRTGKHWSQATISSTMSFNRTSCCEHSVMLLGSHFCSGSAVALMHMQRSRTNHFWNVVYIERSWRALWQPVYSFTTKQLSDRRTAKFNLHRLIAMDKNHLFYCNENSIDNFSSTHCLCLSALLPKILCEIVWHPLSTGEFRWCRFKWVRNVYSLMIYQKMTNFVRARHSEALKLWSQYLLFVICIRTPQ